MNTPFYPKVSIIIPHYNGIDILDDCLTSLQQSTYANIEIIVIDNASKDGSPEIIHQHFPDIILLKNKTNEGFAGGCNRGASQAKGKYLLFLNNDTTQEPDWIEPLVNCLEKEEVIGAVQPKILNYFEKNLFDYAGGSGGHMDILCFPFARGRIFTEQEIDTGQYNASEKVFWASGTAIMVRKDLFIKAEEFDNTFFAHMEEIDLCWRLNMLGYEIWAEPRSVIYHKNATTLPMYSLKKYYLNHRNSMYMMCSNYSILLTIYLFPLRIALEISAIFYALVKLDWKHVVAIIMSVFWVLFHPHLIIKKRRKNRTIKTIRDRMIMKNMFRGSIVWDFYFRRKKYFSELVK